MNLFVFMLRFFSVLLQLDTKNPTKLNGIINDLKKLDDQQLESIANLVKGLTKK